MVIPVCTKNKQDAGLGDLSTTQTPTGFGVFAPLTLGSVIGCVDLLDQQCKPIAPAMHLPSPRIILGVPSISILSRAPNLFRKPSKTQPAFEKSDG